ncbi:MAG: cytochrome P450 [Chitinophagaceae bacterium]|nr:cytochrome P450 [Anaerolineae bacterium]
MTLKAPVGLDIPGQSPMPIVGWRGNALQFYIDPLDYMQKAKMAYGNIVRFVRGGNSSLLYAEGRSPGTVFVFGPEYNRHILSDISGFEVRPAGGPNTPAFQRLMNSVVFVNGTTHKYYRQLMMPAFHKKRIELYRDDMVAITQKVLDEWQPGQQRNILKDMQRLTLIIANKTLFGVDASDEADSVGVIIQDWFSLLTSPAAIIKIDAPGLPFRRLRELSDLVDDKMRAMIAQKRAHGMDDGDVLSMLIQARDENGSGLTDDEIIGNANTLFIAGHETTANTLSWTLFLLAQHPQVLRDLYDELNGVLQGNAPSVEQLNQLPLLDAVIKESMRVLPSGALSIRIASTDLELGDYPIPQFTEVIFNRFDVHHSPDIYTQADRFIPQRWFEINPSPYEYLPFNAGARMCIGATFAMFELKIVLAMLLQRYRLQVVPGATINRKIGFTMSPAPGMPMMIHAQDRAFEGNRVEVKGRVTEMVELPL